MQIVHLPVTGSIFSKIVFVSKYLHFRLNEKKRLLATNLIFWLKCWRRGKSKQKMRKFKKNGSVDLLVKYETLG